MGDTLTVNISVPGGPGPGPSGNTVTVQVVEMFTGKPIPGALVSSDVETLYADTSGLATVTAELSPEGSLIKASAPGYVPGSTRTTQSTTTIKLIPYWAVGAGAGVAFLVSLGVYAVARKRR